jgi:micrococcal nuclease
MYEYKAKLIKVVDADTMDFQIDVGFKMTTLQRIRLANVDAPERFTHHGKRLTQYVKDLFEKNGNDVVIHTEKSDAFGRYIAWVFWKELVWKGPDPDDMPQPDTCLNGVLLEDKHVTVWKKR